MFVSFFIYGNKKFCEYCEIKNFLLTKCEHTIDILNNPSSIENKLYKLVHKHRTFIKDIRKLKKNKKYSQDFLNYIDNMSYKILRIINVIDFMIKKNFYNPLFIYLIYIILVAEINHMFIRFSPSCVKCKIFWDIGFLTWNLFIYGINTKINTYIFITNFKKYINLLIEYIVNFYKSLKKNKKDNIFMENINNITTKYCFYNQNLIELKMFFLVLEKIEGYQVRFEKKQPSFH
ncbi:hypothetical protein AB836_00510 [Rickettsiales bacterium (ex Bugula neritina AB1)]|nr:hypothetical protein AB836_00510 [Rickettsiales bacterium (ex Bugula neritina AB1)]